MDHSGKLRLCVYDFAHRMDFVDVDIPSGLSPKLTFADTEWQLEGEGSIPGKLNLRAEVISGSTPPVSMGLSLAVSGWSKECYLLMPGAVYAGNRFPVVRSLRYEDLDAASTCSDPIITNVPRLEHGYGHSEVQQKVSDLSMSALGFWDPQSGSGLVLTAKSTGPFSDLSFAVRENEDRSEAEIEIKIPGIRERVRYAGHPSRDRGRKLITGDVLELEIVGHPIRGDSPQVIFDKLFELRCGIFDTPETEQQIPFASAWNILEKKYAEQNWVEEYGYFSVGMREVPSQDWQTGWVGGLNAVYPLVEHGNEETARRALRTFDFLASCGIGASGYLKPCFSKGEWHGNDVCQQRYQGDGLYFMIKSFVHAEQRFGKPVIKDEWKQMARGLSDALCKTWDTYGEFGHRFEVETGELNLTGSASGGLAPGALALASVYFDNARYLDVAKASMQYYCDHFVQPCLTNGGPGDIIQCPDSESAFALLEAIITLYEVTGDSEWLAPAVALAKQCASWVVDYDFEFPEKSTFGKLGMLTNGTVIANAQNKHSAPGICSLSGCSFLKLFRATGEMGFLRLIGEIAHAIPQYMSREDRPIVDNRPGQRWPVLAPGWINERVNISDWEERDGSAGEIKVGEVFGGSTWSEVAMLLTASELPGLYLQTDTGIMQVLDHVDVGIVERSGNEVVLEAKNPTTFEAVLRVFAETSGDARSKKLGMTPMTDCPLVKIQPGQTVRFSCGEDGSIKVNQEVIAS